MYMEVHSEWPEALKLYKRQCPYVTTAVIVNETISLKQIIALARLTQSDGVSLAQEAISDDIVRRLHTCKLFIDAWSDTAKTARRLRPFGVTAIAENLTGKVLRI